MTALSADARRAKYGAEYAHKTSLAMAATTIYANAIVAWNASGYAAPAADTANFKVAGLALQSKTNSGSAGSEYIDVLQGVEIEVAVQSSSITIADCGLVCVVYDDNTVSDVATATNDIPCGLVEGMSGSNARVRVGHGFAYAAAA